MQYRSQFLKRLFRPYFIALALVLTAAMFVLYFACTEHVKNNANDAVRSLAEKTSRQAEVFIDELDLLSEQVKKQSGLLNKFTELQNDRSHENYFNKDVLASIDISSGFKNLLINRTDSYHIAVYNNLGDVITSREYNADPQAADLASSGYTGLIHRIIASGGRVISFSDSDKWIGDENDCIILAKALKNDYSDNVYGIVEVRGTTDAFAEALGSDGNAGVIALRDRSTGSIVYPVGQPPDNYTMQNTYPMSGLNWDIVVYYTNPLTRRFKIQLISWLGAAYVILLMLIFGITQMIGKRVTEPLLQLTSYVRRVNAPDSQLIPVNADAIDEIKELEDSFSKMLERVNRAVESEKAAYMAALQAQMNPHFLYNTLAVIGSAGAEYGCTGVYDMCSELSDMLRYTTAYSSACVPLSDELEHTKNYLLLMKARYEDYFTYSIDIERELYSMQVPKLFIQPLAENCFKHGFKEKEPPWRIDIKMTGSAEAWELSVCDNGIGISGEKISEIQTRISDRTAGVRLGGENGLGIVNTIIRLKLTHNENTRLEISSGEGAEIKIITGADDNGGKRDV